MSEGRKYIFRLGVVSFFNDIASEVVLRVLPLYLTEVVKASLSILGFIEALSEGLAVIIRPLSGTLSDHFRRRKPLVVGGYGLSTLTRLGMVLKPGVLGVLLVRVVDRIGKGIRTAPRDAIISDWSDPREYGRSFGLHRSLDSAGAVLGLGAVGLLFHFLPKTEAETINTVIAVAAVFGLMSFLVLVFGVREPSHHKKVRGPRPHLKDLVWFPESRTLRKYFGAVFIFAAASSSDSFLIIRAKELGLSLSGIFILLAGFNLATVLSAIPLGKMSDRLGRKRLLLLGWGIYALAYLGMALTNQKWAFVPLILFYGFYYSASDGVERALIADLVTGGRQGSAYGFLGLVNGAGIFLANVLFGALYQTKGAVTAFLFGSCTAFAAVLLLLFIPLKHRSN